MNREQALAKIKKCLALSKSANPHEAAAGLRQAQALMASHSISDADVTLADVHQCAAPARYAEMLWWEVRLARLVADTFGCTMFQPSKRVLQAGARLVKQSTYVFIGTGSAPEVASYAHDILARQCAKNRLAHIRKQPKSCKPRTLTARGDEYALGWVHGVSGLLDKFAGTEKNSALLEQYTAQRYPNLGSFTPKDRITGRNTNPNDWHAGIQAGRNAQLNRGLAAGAQQGLLA